MRGRAAWEVGVAEAERGGSCASRDLHGHGLLHHALLTGTHQGQIERAAEVESDGDEEEEDNADEAEREEWSARRGVDRRNKAEGEQDIVNTTSAPTRSSEKKEIVGCDERREGEGGGGTRSAESGTAAWCPVTR